MRKFSILIIVVLFLFTACGNGEGRGVTRYSSNAFGVDCTSKTDDETSTFTVSENEMYSMHIRAIRSAGEFYLEIINEDGNKVFWTNEDADKSIDTYFLIENSGIYRININMKSFSGKIAVSWSSDIK